MIKREINNFQKPSVLVVNERFYPLVGGAEVQCQQIAGELLKIGYHIQVVTKRWREEFHKIETLKNGVKINRIGIPGFNRFSDYFCGLALFFFLIKNFHDYEILFVDSGLANIFASTAIITGKLLGKTIIAKFETPGELTFSGKKSLSPKKIVHPLIKIRLYFVKLADYYLAQTAEMKKELVTFGIKEDKIKLFPNSVDEGIFCPPTDPKQAKILKSKYKLPPEKLILFFCGRLVARKGLITLIKAWKQVVDSSNNAVLVVVGSGSNQPDSVEEQLYETVKKEKLEDRVIFLGDKGREDVADLLKTADIFVYPSIHPEGRAVSVLEAMSVELPVIASNIGGLNEIITNNINGFLVEKNNPGELAIAITKLLDSESLRIRLGNSGRKEVINKYSLKMWARDLDHFINSITK